MAEGFDPSGIRLPELKVETWQGWVYVSLNDESEPLASRLAEIEARLANFRMAEDRPVRRAEMRDTDWKAPVDNFTESCHLFQAHKNSVEPALPTALTPTTFPAARSTATFTSTAGPARLTNTTPSEAQASRPIRRSSRRSGCSIPPVCVNPAHLIALSRERNFWIVLRPRGSGRIRVRWGLDAFPRTIPEGGRRIADPFAAFDRINEEDRGIVEAIRQNAAARHAASGPLSPKERSIWELRRFLAARLGR